MKFSEVWLREFVNPALNSEALAHQLTMAGLEVEEYKTMAPAFEQVVIGHIVEITPHPNADKLRICTVDVGKVQPLQIVCGAANASVGVKVPCALVGATLPSNFKIKAATLRGVPSNGMLCSAKELGLVDDSDGLLILPSDAPIGQDFRQYGELDDQLFHLKITPNRADCLSIYGVAREVAVLTQSPLKAWPLKAASITSNKKLTITLDAPDACVRYCGRIIDNVDANVPTPLWIKRRLERSGLHSVSAIVDITNYVLLELGQPLHAFDASKIIGDIKVRWADDEESTVLLNNKEVKLTPDLLVIADDHKSIALAGIMGSANSAINESTTSIFLESAFFKPEAIVGRARTLNISSDAAYRFERGVDATLAIVGLERATELIVAVCGGQVGPISEATAQLPIPAPLQLRSNRVAKLLGISIPDKKIIDYLESLGFKVKRSQPDCWEVTVPSYRFDIAIEEDMIEEIARLYGFDNIPIKPVNGLLKIQPIPGEQIRLSEVIGKLVARDYHEVINYAFVDRQWEQNISANDWPIALQNPIASHMSVMRSSLLGGLIETLINNVNRKQERVRIFEVGNVFIRPEQQIDQQKIDQQGRLAGLLYGTRYPEQWAVGNDRVDFYDVKGDIEALLYPHVLRFERLIHPALHPGRAAQLYYENCKVGILGELHPLLVQKYQLPYAPMVFEVDLAMLISKPTIKAADISKLPFVRRDLAFVVDSNLPAQQMLTILKTVSSPLIKEINLFDIYQGPGIEVGKKSLAFKVILQDKQKMLTEVEVNAVIEQLIANAYAQCSATLRI